MRNTWHGLEYVINICEHITKLFFFEISKKLVTSLMLYGSPNMNIRCIPGFSIFFSVSKDVVDG